MKSANPIAIIANRALARDRHELAFLPAAVEILETPVSPVHRATLLTICGMLLLAVVWTGVTYVDTTSTAPGKIVPSGKSKSVQPFSTGVVRAIYVDDGKKVSAGEVLIELDPTISDADLGRVRGDLFAAQMEMARLRAALVAAGGADPRAAFHPPEGADKRLVDSQLALLLNQVNEFRSKIAVLDRQIAQKQSERGSVMSTIAKDQALIPILKQQVDMRKALFDQNYGSKLSYLEILQQLTGLEQDLSIQRDALRTAEAALQAVVEQRMQTESEFKRMLSDTIAADEAKAAGLEQDLIKAQELSKRQTLTAPVDGVVQQLAVHTIGGVVTPAQTLMVIVPSDSHLEIEAMVSNNDIGFVRPGQKAQIKIGTFDFTRYGMLNGEVVFVSPDAVTPQQLATTPGAAPSGADPTTQAAQAGNSGGQASGAVYAARISLDRDYMDVGGKNVKLSPGMTVTAEIKTGNRTILSYLMSSVGRASDAFHER